MNALQPASDDRMLRLLVESVVDYAIYLLDPEGRVSSWNAGAQRIKGYMAEEVLGRSYSMFFTEEERDLGRPEENLEVARRHGRSESEGWRLRKDGTRFWAYAVLDTVYDEAGRLIGFAKITRDMTERHAAEQALRESERRFRLLAQGVTDYAIFMLDLDGTVANWNAGARRIKGYEATEIIGQHFSRFYTEEDRADGVPYRALQQARTTGKFEAEGWRVRKDGSHFWASVVIDAIHDDDGHLIGFAKITRDLTERLAAQRALEEAREQLLQAQKLEALGQLTGGIAHDFNNLLQIMAGGVTLAEKLAAGNDRLRRIIDEMRNATERGAALTRQLLVFSRRAPIRPEVLDTAESVRSALGLFSRSLRGDIQVEHSLEDGLWPIRVDHTQFELALLNIAVNARDAMPQGGRLRVTATNVSLDGKPDGLAGRFVAIRLRDTGTGIPQELLARIFEPFFTTKPVGQGTGLGLSQAHGFAQQAGGTVTVASKVNEGTEVTLFLPAASPAEIRQQQDDAARTERYLRPSCRGLRILVVDDDAAVGRLTARMLEDAGHRASATTEPKIAIEWLSNGERFDVVLSDVIMPGGRSGTHLAREIRRRWPGLPVLLASGYIAGLDSIQQEFPVLQKPFTTLELIRAIETVVRHLPGSEPE